MWLNILFNSFLYLLIIFIFHKIYLYFKQEFSTPKIKDLVSHPRKKYKQIYEEISKQNNEKEEPKSMKLELEHYLNNLIQTN